MSEEVGLPFNRFAMLCRLHGDRGSGGRDCNNTSSKTYKCNLGDCPVFVDQVKPNPSTTGRSVGVATTIPKNVLRVKIQEKEAITTIEYELKGNQTIQYYVLCDIMHFMVKGVLISVELVKLQRQIITNLYHHGHMHNTTKDFDI